jgi:hypothetical protein
VTLSSIGKFIVIDVINSGITVFLKISEAKKAKGSKTMTKTTKFVRAFPNNSQYDLLPFIEIYILDLINQGKLQVIFEELEWKRNPALLFDFLPLELIFSFKLEFESDRKKTNRCSDGLEHSKVILVNRQDFSVSSEYLKQLSLFWYGEQEFTNKTYEEMKEEQNAENKKTEKLENADNEREVLQENLDPINPLKKSHENQETIFEEDPPAKKPLVEEYNSNNESNRSVDNPGVPKLNESKIRSASEGVFGRSIPTSPYVKPPTKKKAEKKNGPRRKLNII